MRNLRFRDRVLIYFFTVIFLPILLLGVLAPSLYSRTVARLSADHMKDMVEMVTKNVHAETKVRDCNPSYVVTSVGVVVIDTPQLPTQAVRMRR